jgi:hypothetical protein
MQSNHDLYPIKSPTGGRLRRHLTGQALSPARSCLAVAGLSAYTAQAGGHRGRGIFSTFYETIGIDISKKHKEASERGV